MRPEDLTGAIIEQFTYDTPQAAQQDFYALCNDDKPLILVFMPNFGHPISRVYLAKYRESVGKLHSGRLACVVRSKAQVIAQRLDEPLPFTLICDAEGVLYEYFEVQKTASRFSWSMLAARIFRDAKKQGYQVEKEGAQILPLTLVVGRGGKILAGHYGESLTDMPEDCAAMERACSHVLAVQRGEDPAPEQDEPDPEDPNSEVLFPGREMPAPRPEDGEEGDPDHTQPIDWQGWHEPGKAAQPAEEDMATPLAGQESDKQESDKQPKWNKLLGLFSESED